MELPAVWVLIPAGGSMNRELLAQLSAPVNRIVLRFDYLGLMAGLSQLHQARQQRH